MKTSFTKERKAIENLYRKLEFDEIGNLPGIRVIERRDPELDFNRHYLCKHYIFGDAPVDWPTFSTSCDYTEVSDPEEGDIIFYFKENVAAHVGIYTGNNIVRSKWSCGHIYEHSVNHVPISFGNNARFFRKVHSISGTNAK